MDKLKETFGYALGFVLFVVLIPVVMWLCSKMPAFKMPQPFLLGIAIFCIIDGLFLSIWAIVYMRRVGDGNPMLTGIFVYLIGCCICLWTWQSVVVFFVFAAIMLVQVRTEEERLHRDFGEEYEKYCNQTGRFSPKIRKK